MTFGFNALDGHLHAGDLATGFTVEIISDQGRVRQGVDGKREPVTPQAYTADHTLIGLKVMILIMFYSNQFTSTLFV